MKTTYLKTVILFTLFISLISCDTNDNNDPNTPCDARFFNFVTDGDGSTNGTFNLFDYQKSTGFNMPNQLLGSNQNFLLPNLGIRYAKSAIEPNSGIIEYKIADIAISYDINNNSVTQTPLTGALMLAENPEFLNGNLYFLKPDNIMPTSIQIVDENGVSISPSLNINMTNSGLLNANTFSSTSNLSDKIYYLENTNLITYDANSNTLSSVSIDTFNMTTNRVFYFGLEYVNNNTLYALQGNATSGQTIKLVKIDISNPSSPQISTLLDLTNSSALSFNPYSIVNGNAYVESDYDSCDNSYYIAYTIPAGTNAQAYLVELKLNSNAINEYPSVPSVYYFGLDHLQ